MKKICYATMFLFMSHGLLASDQVRICSPLDSDLIQAVRAGDRGKVLMAIMSGANVNATCSLGSDGSERETKPTSALYEARAFEQWSVMYFLLKSNANWKLLAGDSRDTGAKLSFCNYKLSSDADAALWIAEVEKLLLSKNAPVDQRECEPNRD